MRLTSAHIRGVGRLTDSSIKLDQKLVAIVGPNEAGKSTLLKALAMSGTGDALSPPERSRGAEVPDATRFVTLYLTLEQDDVDLLSDLPLNELPARMTVSRRADGGAPTIELQPEPRKSAAIVVDVQRALIKSIPSGPLLPRSDTGEPETDETPEEYQDRAQLLTDLKGLGTDVLTLAKDSGSSDVDRVALRAQASSVLPRLSAFTLPDSLREALQSLIDWLDIPEPGEEVRSRLAARVPDMALFTDADRGLQSAYALDAALLAATPPALTNLARLAELDLSALVAAVEGGEISRRNTLKNRANKKLAAHFSTAWQQSELTVELNVENNTLRIGLVEDEVFASVLDERSQGLRTFVALSAFLAARDSGRPTVLLIDEAENHLHINAQADLVEMFAQQAQAAKVIYTTHSPACLPADLGVGIRAVVVDGEETSHIENSFWRQTGPALTSLMMAMGASAAAFTPARCVVVAEGASDMILLPTLLRAATGLRKLPYQVAPGLSELPRDLYPDLDLEAAKVAYLVDGDSGGEDLAKAVGRSVPDDLVVSLRVPGIENLLPAELYTEVLETAVREATALGPIGAPLYPGRYDSSWSKAADAWLESQGHSPPSKVVVASLVAERAHVTLEDDVSRLLREVHTDICRALGIGADVEVATTAR